ncbi:breast cancer type 2 susceptibility protein [Takifugu flavidus]|uniref:breast cancer type 2 susceptibility protein n=1 Tax=Takifugu flavidus TaxID=433684 RepID=UPI00254472B2|nr:breast cancer type 2 susceptibility protein [Takifugu flavidus]
MRVNTAHRHDGHPTTFSTLLTSGMDFPSKNLYEVFKDEIWKDLGPLDPDWFQVLTLQALTNEGNISFQDDLCPNQEGHFKPAIDSQLFSTPKLFRHCQVLSPETEREQSLADGHENDRLPWMPTQSPCLLPKDGIHCPVYGGILGASQHFPSSHVKRISESLGAEIHPDISWTSSLNTPPPSTLILPKPDESPCPVSLSEERNVVLVRKLFPSLSNPSRAVVASPKNNNLTTVHKGDYHGGNDNPEGPNNSQGTCDWKQKLPDAIEDQELRSTVASVLEGAEDVLTNPSSTLKKVKTDRVKGKEMAQKTKDNSIPTDIGTSEHPVSSDETTAHRETEGHSPTAPLKAGDVRVTQWSPLSLSEILVSTGHTYEQNTSSKEEVKNSRAPEELQCDFDIGKQERPRVNTRHIGLTKKKRTFVYTVETPKRQNLAGIQSQKEEPFPVIQQDVYVTTMAKEQVSGCSVKENDAKCQADLTEKSLHPSVKAKLQDLDISQLSKDFAQDFSQMPEPDFGKDTSDVFSPSACLSALKRANKKSQADISTERDVGNRSVIASNQKSLIDESTISDSGFQSAVGNGTHITASSLCETDIHKAASNEETGNNCLGSKSIIPVMKNEECTSAKRNIHRMSLYEKDLGTKEKTYASTVASGFKTASNKGIHVLSDNLERAKHVFEESVSEPSSKGICLSKDELGLIHKSAKNTTCNSNRTLSLSGPHLTASQKADMTELCTLLEEADSQFEFTQFRTAETKEPWQENTTSSKKELDADLLTGINFDDSFSSDAEKHLMQDKKSDISSKLSQTCKSTSFSCDAVKVGKCSEDVLRISHGTSSAVSTEQHALDRENNLMLGFKTAGGNILKVSKQCLSKAKDLFADLEPHFQCGTSQSQQRSRMDSKMHNASTDSHARLLNEEQHNSAASNRRVMGGRDGTKNSNMHASKCQNGFQLASGKVISVSEKALQDAAAFFSDCGTVDNNSDTSVRHKEGAQPVGNHKSSFQKCKNVQGFKEKCLNRDIPEFKKGNVSPTTGHTDLEDGTCGTSPSKAVSSPFTSTASRHIASSSLSATNPGPGFCSDVDMSEDTNRLAATQKLVPSLEKCGFQTASGKGVSISHEALRKAKTLLQDCGEDEGKIRKEQIHFKMPFAEPPARSSGFHTASGKATACSSEALQKAKALFSDISSNVETLQTNQDDPKQDHIENEPKIHCGFSTAGGGKVHISQKSLLKAKNLFKEFDSATENQEPDDSFKGCDIVDDRDDFSAKQRETLAVVSRFHEMNRTNVCTNVPPAGHGFHMASGRKVSVSDEAMVKAKSLMDESVTLEGRTEYQKPKIDTFPSQNGGFQTASGRKVSVSDEAMMKAKSLLNEYVKLEGIEEDQKPKIDTFPAQNGGFQMAGGKGYNILSGALQKAKPLFSESEHVEDKPNHSKIPCLADSGKEISFSSVAPREEKAVSVSAEFSDSKQGEHEDALKNKEIIHHAFTTAGGARVHVSQKSLLKAKSLLNDIADGQTSFSNSCSTSQHDSENLLKSRNLSKASNKDVFSGVHSSNSLLMTKQKGQNTQSGVSPSSVGAGANMSRTLKTELSNVAIADKSSLLCFQSFDINDCSETQQAFLAQEALDCTKALLEDESLLLDDDPRPADRSADDRKRKRLVEDSDLTNHPPLKRRLLEEFDRTDGSRGSTLIPEKCSPNGIMKDRRVFNYNRSFCPTITTPHSGENFKETRLQITTPTKASTLSDINEAPLQESTFIPPFLKNTRSGSPKGAVLKDNITTPSALIPPFKKLKKSSKTEEEDKHHFLTPITNQPAAPSSKKCTVSLTSNKPAEDSPQVALAETGNDELVMSPRCQAARGSENPAAEAECVRGTLSRVPFQHLHHFQLARDMQEMRIRKKKRQTIRPLPGSLFQRKSSGVARIPFKAAVNGKPPARYTARPLCGLGVPLNVLEITSETAESFRFSLQHFVKLESLMDKGGIQLADGGWLIPTNDGTAGKEEFYRALCDTPGVDPKLMSEEWVYNHYRWIVWKQASMERSFPEEMGSLCLTPEQVLLQLKYRYDIEVDHSRRPALRKIMEKDDTAAKTLVLCVCGVVFRGSSPKNKSFGDISTPGADPKVENPCAVVWLTDGWYSIKAQLDGPLTSMLHRGRLPVGGKLIIHGAQLVGSENACSPLEAPVSLMLKICANSSRPARWDSKLGFHRDPRPFLLPVSSLYSSGGPVGCVDIIILRSYPILWMERKPEGGTVFRSGRAEEKEARRYNIHKEKAMEILFDKIKAEFEKEEKGNRKPQRRRTINGQNITSLQDGEELYEAVGDDPAFLEAHLTEKQVEVLQNYKRLVMEKQQAELQDRYRRAVESAEDGVGGCPKRDVAPVWRLCIADSMGHSGRVYQLSLWRPPSELQALLKEGCRYKVYNLTTLDSKKQGGNATVQLTATKKTQFEHLQASEEWLSKHFQPRVATNFVRLQDPEFNPLCSEVDLTGYVITIIDGQGFSPAFYLADGKQNFVKVRCFSSFAQSGLEDVIKPRVLLALSNLQLRGQSTSPTPVVYAGDLTVFSTNPKEVHLQESFSQLKTLVQGQENFFVHAEEKLSQLMSDGLSAIASPAGQIQTPASTVKRRGDMTDVTCQQPGRSHRFSTPINRNSTAHSSAERNPSTIKKRKALDYLSHIPSPPPLSCLSTLSSPSVKKIFIPPRRTETPGTLKTVKTPNQKPSNTPVDDQWVNDEELAMIDTQALHVG